MDAIIQCESRKIEESSEFEATHSKEFLEIQEEILNVIENVKLTQSKIDALREENESNTRKISELMTRMELIEIKVNGKKSKAEILNSNAATAERDPLIQEAKTLVKELQLKIDFLEKHRDTLEIKSVVVPPPPPPIPIWVNTNETPSFGKMIKTNSNKSEISETAMDDIVSQIKNGGFRLKPIEQTPTKSSPEEVKYSPFGDIRNMLRNINAYSLNDVLVNTVLPFVISKPVQNPSDVLKPISSKKMIKGKEEDEKKATDQVKSKEGFFNLFRKKRSGENQKQTQKREEMKETASELESNNDGNEQLNEFQKVQRQLSMRRMQRGDFIPNEN